MYIYDIYIYIFVYVYIPTRPFKKSYIAQCYPQRALLAMCVRPFNGPHISLYNPLWGATYPI